MAVLIVATSMFAVLGLARHRDLGSEGLRGSYFATLGWDSQPDHLTLDRQPSTQRLLAAWDGHPPSAFSATWTGSFIALREDRYTFATASDDGSWVYVDGVLVVDNAGRHGTELAKGSIHLAPGVHGIFIKYFQDGGGLHLELLWSRGAAALEPVPAWALSVGHPWFPRFAARVAVARSLPFIACLWLAILGLSAGTAAWPRIAALGAAVSRDRSKQLLLAITAGSLVLNVTGIWWGLPGSWAGDETTPTLVQAAIEQHFSGGWFDRYPALQFYVLTAVWSPWLLVRSIASARPIDGLDLVAGLVLSRVVSVAAALGTLVALYACGARAFGTRAGLLAAAMMALVAPFVFYAKTANPEAPYVFWVALSLVFYLRFLHTLAPRDIVWFAAAATLALCTKDQAYALYLATPLVLVYHLWESRREAGARHPWLRALGDRRLVLAAATAALAFATVSNLAFNWVGFVRHVRYITGPGSRLYRGFEPTLGGRLALLHLTADLEQRTWGWPFWIVTLIGTIVALSERASRRVAICLALLVVSYYAGFIDVILYNYDRYLLPVCLVQALFGGLALDRFLGPPGGRQPRFRAALVAGLFAYTLLYAGTVDVLMLRDSRYQIERWLKDHAGPGDIVGTMFPAVVLPRLDDVHAEDIGSIEELRQEAPAFYILNADYARAVPPDSPAGRLIAGLQRHTLGYTLAVRDRSPSPWAWLPGGHPDLVGPRLAIATSFLSDINPTTEVYRRDPAPSALPAQ